MEPPVLLNNLPLSRLPFTILKMTLEDLPEVMTIEQTAYSSPWPEDVYRRELLNERAHFALVKYQTGILGYSGTWHIADEIRVGTIVSHPLVRGRGIGELLLVMIIGRGVEQSANIVTLEVRPSNQSARSLYRKYGFMEAGIREDYYSDTGEEAIIMVTPSLTSPTYQALFQPLVTNLFDRLATFKLDELHKLT